MAGKKPPRPDQVMAQALCDFITDGKVPPSSLAGMAQKASSSLAKVGPTNLVHMGSVLCLLLKLSEAADRLAAVYRANVAGAFRSVFEGLSVGYSGYQSLGWLAAIRCTWGPPFLRAEARAQLRQDLTVQALCSTKHGRVVIACGRAYGTDADVTPDPGDEDVGVVVPATDYRVRAVRGITDDGWWPKGPGIGKKFWSDTASVSARPWKEDPDLPELLFGVEERAALNRWVTERFIGSVLLALIQPVRVHQILTVAHVEGGHLAWMEDIQSYAEGKNSAQPLVWAQGDKIKKAAVTDPPTGALLTKKGFEIGGDLVLGFPMPSKPHIKFSMEAPVVAV